jgi:hypothetical protein
VAALAIAVDAIARQKHGLGQRVAVETAWLGAENDAGEMAGHEEVSCLKIKAYASLRIPSKRRSVKRSVWLKKVAKPDLDHMHQAGLML